MTMRAGIFVERHGVIIALQACACADSAFFQRQQTFSQEKQGITAKLVGIYEGKQKRFA
jgi:hypothetical protein